MESMYKNLEMGLGTSVTWHLRSYGYYYLGITVSAAIKFFWGPWYLSNTLFAVPSVLEFLGILIDEWTVCR